MQAKRKRDLRRFVSFLGLLKLTKATRFPEKNLDEFSVLRTRQFSRLEALAPN
jgi:hypothetical protein